MTTGIKDESSIPWLQIFRQIFQLGAIEGGESFQLFQSGSIFLPDRQKVLRKRRGPGAYGCQPEDTRNMKNGRAFIVKSEPTSSIVMLCLSITINNFLRSEQVIFDDHSLENPNRKRGMPS